jgi:hypothetical protein
MGNIRLIQYLCPERHCIVGMAYDARERTAEDALNLLKNSLAEAGLNPWCGICGSRNLWFEDAATKFVSLEEALPRLKEEEAKQILSRALIENLRAMARRN